MDLWAIICLSLALAVDVFGIAFAYGLVIKKHRIKMMLRLAVTCGVCQFIMPVFGYLGTAAISSFVAKFDYLLVFAIFTLLGLNIIGEALSADEQAAKSKKLTWRITFMIGIATSIDALVSGTMIYLTKTSLLMSASVIGLGSLIVGLIGFNLNYCLKRVPEKYLQFLAGLVLIGLGVKSLFLH